jgi:hypothetical protein
VLSRREERELYALVLQADELRGTPDLVDAARAIVDWHARLPLTRLERDLAERAWLARVLRECQP